MAYTVLARRYRSRNFDELVGQEAVATTLKNAIAAGRVAHAYLFTGTRGVGKTSSARILAKALNCVHGPTPNPCSECDICKDIARGEDVDVIEIDGASNTSVEDVRQLRNNAIYRPARARFKIYIIDEVHMISTSAFNALLKTLEEPPEHVKFIFATTEPNKVPITIQSRCQRFDFKPISKAGIAEQIRKILAAEEIQAETSVIDRVARLANGSMRDALSLLDQILSVGQKNITADLANQFLPVPPIEQYAAIVDGILNNDPASILHKVDAILSTGTSANDFCLALSEYLRDVMVASACKADRELLDSPENVHEQLGKQAQRLKPLNWAYGITVVEELARSVKFSEQARPLIDAAMVTLSYLPDLVDAERMPDGLKASSSSPADSVSEPAKKKFNAPVISPPVDDAPPIDDPGPISEMSDIPEPDFPAPASSSHSPSPLPVVDDSPIQTQTGKTVSPFHAGLSEPVVRKLIDVFDGRLVDVTPAGKETPQP
jgi:DNA polymerase-3 subunit gamma/tau